MLKSGASRSVKVVSENKLVLAVGTAFAMTSATYAQTAPSLPSGYEQIGTDASSAFNWAKAFKIGIVVFLFVMSLVGLARSKK